MLFCADAGVDEVNSLTTSPRSSRSTKHALGPFISFVILWTFSWRILTGTILGSWKFFCTMVEQGLTSHSTQFRSFRRRRFYRSDDPTNSVKALKEGG